MTDVSPTHPMKVLFVGACYRSGSTLLDRLLGASPQSISCGELCHLPDQLLEDRPCSCGAPLQQCEFWREVIRDAFGKISDTDLHDWIASRKAVDRPRHFVTLIWPSWQSKAFRIQLKSYYTLMIALYTSITRISKAQVIVDSSKVPSHAVVLNGLRPQGVDAFFIHLVRDSRAVAYSWASHSHLTPTSIGKAILWWDVFNTMLDYWSAKCPHDRHLRVCYEDLATSPKYEVGRIADVLLQAGFLDSQWRSDSIIHEHTVTLSSTHLVAGNPMRYNSGDVAIRPDDEWRYRTSWVKHTCTTIVTLPHLIRYGYIGSRNRIPSKTDLTIDNTR